ncbi:hypothetical protein RP20_CCG023704 [Aedes albopictus]|nr:hypothetical protein RP20_CCG023704 [Aedes albopictus]
MFDLAPLSALSLAAARQTERAQYLGHSNRCPLFLSTQHTIVTIQRAAFCFGANLNPSQNIREKMRLFEQDASLDEFGQYQPHPLHHRRRYSDTSNNNSSRSSSSSSVSVSYGGGPYQSQSHAELGPNLTGRMMPPINHSQAVMTDSQGLIVPKKLANPCIESMDRQNLHRELMFNQKM